MEMLKLILILAIMTKPLFVIFADDNLHIDSENLVLDREKNTAIFTGNVVICFHSMKLHSQKAIFTFAEQNTRKIKLIEFPEKVEAIRDTTDNTEPSVIIADNAIYTAANMELVLKGHVIIEDAKEIIVTDQMLYYGKLTNIELTRE